MEAEIINFIDTNNTESIVCNPVLLPSKTMAKFICALSNVGGGYIALGTINENKKIKIVGLSSDFKTDTIINKSINLINPSPDIEISNMMIEGKNIYIVKVKKTKSTLFIDGFKYVYEQEKLIKSMGEKILDKTKVFIVHGHDNLAKQETARFVENLGLKAIILHEQASAGNTIIEKIEAHSNVGFAIILYTPCDLGKAKDSQTCNPRARQNVIFEHGYLMGKIGRNNVCALVKSQVEKPNDLSGVVYVEMDDNGAWKNMLIKEMKNSGYEIDANKLYM